MDGLLSLSQYRNPQAWSSLSSQGAMHGHENEAVHAQDRSTGYGADRIVAQPHRNRANSEAAHTKDASNDKQQSSERRSAIAAVIETGATRVTAQRQAGKRWVSTDTEH